MRHIAILEFPVEKKFEVYEQLKFCFPSIGLISLETVWDLSDKTHFFDGTPVEIYEERMDFPYVENI